MQALLASPLGFFIGLALGALGGGGSILAVPALVYGAGQDPKHATASSLVLVGIAALVGMVRHWRAGRVRVGVGVVFGLVGVGGSIAGSAVNRRLDPNALLVGFAMLVLVAAWRMLTACPTCTNAGEQQAVAVGGAGDSRGRFSFTTILITAVAATVVGFLAGLFGVGGGFVIVPALTLALRLPMPQAIGTSLLVIAMNSAVALATRLATTSIQWGVTVPFVVAAVIGVLLGGHVADRIDAKKSLRGFAALLVAVAVYTGLRGLLG
jgi:uncharacterized membrane protein YfcA